jgi:hypothetical protein
MSKLTIMILCSLFVFTFSFQQDNRTVNFPKKEEVPTQLPRSENFWIFIMAGQSNMAGRGFVEPQDTIPNTRVLTLNKDNKWVIAKEPLHFYQPALTGLDCGMSFALELLKSAGDSITIGLVPCAVGGSSVDNWLDDKAFNEVELSRNFKERTKVALKSGKIKAILWHQGESDASVEKIYKYKSSIETLFRRFRKVVGNDSLPIIMGELGSYYYPEDQQALWDSINVQIRSIATKGSNCFWIPTDDLTPNEDRIHFNSASQRELGRRYADKFFIISAKN